MKLANLFFMVLVSLLLLPAGVLAHPGHGDEGGLPHAIEHGAWLLGAVFLAVMLCRTLLKKQMMIKNNKHINQKDK